MSNYNLKHPNPIRALVPWACEVLTESKCESSIPKLVQLQLGNPRFNEPDFINQAMIAAINNKAVGTGYDPHSGCESDRKQMTELIKQLYSTSDIALDIDWTHVTLTNGATVGVNAALNAAKKSAHDHQAVCLVSVPGYPPYESIARLNGLHPIGYNVSSSNNYFLTLDSLELAIQSAGAENIRLIIYNYPHNPTGATPDKQQAQDMANVINQLNKKYPEIIFLEEALYLATITADHELWMPYVFLSPAARARTIVVGSGSKMGLAAARAGFIFSTDKQLAEICANYISLTLAGSGYIAHAGYLEVLAQMAMCPGQKIYQQEHPRAQIAGYFQERIHYMAKGLEKIAHSINLNLEDVVTQIPKGGMYLWVDFSKFFEGHLIPEPLRIGPLKTRVKFENAADLQYALLIMAYTGAQPVLIPSGDIFGEKFGIKTRLSCVTPQFKELEAAICTIKNLVAMVHC